MLSQGDGKRDLQAGLRAEYASRDFTLPADRAIRTATRSLFPSGMAVYKLNDGPGKLSYSRRIRRPGTQELNPFPQFFDPQNVFFGNPELNPEYTDAFELGFQHRGSWARCSSRRSTATRATHPRLVNTADTVQGAK